jgi:hypothetical protein
LILFINDTLMIHLRVIGELKKVIESKLGRQIERRGDCQFLSDRIDEELNEFLSYNTIRRVFGVENGCEIKPSISTLNILAQFIGYKSFELFKKNADWSREWSTQLRVNGWIDRMDDQEIIIELTLARHRNDDFLISLVSILRELFLLGNIQLINRIFKNPNYKLDHLTYSESLFLANGVGSILRKIEIDETVLVTLANNKKFIENVILSFVDYSSLEGYYGQISVLLNDGSIKIKNDQKLFFKSILSLKSLLQGRKIDCLNYELIIKESLHPILVSRLASIQIAFHIQNSEGYDYILDDIKGRITKLKFNQIDYLYELQTISLLTKDFSLMRWICSIGNIEIEEEYHVSHQQYFFVVNLLFAIHEKRFNEAQTILSKLDERKWILSYYEFFQVFHFISMYHISKNFNRRKMILKSYCSLCASLKYSLLNENFLLHYFDE